MQNLIEANGKAYEVIFSETVFEVRNNGRDNTAKAMEAAGIAQTHLVKALKGKILYQIHEYKSGNYGKAVRAA